MKIDKTPLEVISGITILSPEDIIEGWEGVSKLIYCYKNDLDLSIWMDLLSGDFIERCVEKEYDQLDDSMREDFLQIGLYINMMKLSNWSKGVHERIVAETIVGILTTFILIESMNRKTYAQWGRNYLPGSGKLIDTYMHRKPKYNINSYSFRNNPGVIHEVRKDSDGNDVIFFGRKT